MGVQSATILPTLDIKKKKQISKNKVRRVLGISHLPVEQ